MTAPFTAQLRTHRAIELPRTGDALTIRVESAELWDAVRVAAGTGTTVDEVKARALAALLPNEEYPEDYVLKYRGWEMLDERASLADAGVVDGAILLLAHRRRRPVR